MRIMVLTVFVLSLMGCGSVGIKLPPPEKNWQVFPTPRTFDGPGTVFRIDSNGRKFPVAQLDVEIVEPGKESFASYSREVTWGLNVLIQYVAAREISASAATTANSTLTIRLGDGFRKRTLDDAITKALKKAAIARRPANRYFVIRETAAVKEINFDLSSGSALTAEAKAVITEAIKGTAGAKWGNSERTQLVRTFEQPHYVYYTVEEIPARGLGLTSSSEQRLPVIDPLTWVADMGE